MLAWTVVAHAVLSGLGFVWVGRSLAFKNGFSREVFIQLASMIAQLVLRLKVNQQRKTLEIRDVTRSTCKQPFSLDLQSPEPRSPSGKMGPNVCLLSPSVMQFIAIETSAYFSMLLISMYFPCPVNPEPSTCIVPKPCLVIHACPLTLSCIGRLQGSHNLCSCAPPLGSS